MPDEFLFDPDGAGKSDIFDQLIEAEQHIPGLVFSYPPISSWRPTSS